MSCPTCKTRGSLFCDEHRHTSAPPAPSPELAKVLNDAAEHVAKWEPWQHSLDPQGPPAPPAPAVPLVHKNTEGGNDYVRCRDCGAEWDYRREPAPATCVPAASDLCLACGFPKSDGYVHPVLPSAQRCDHRQRATPTPIAPEGVEQFWRAYYTDPNFPPSDAACKFAEARIRELERNHE